MISRRRLSSVFIPLFALAMALAQDETPTKITDQNRSGDLPFSTTVGTDVEHVVVAGGNLVVNVPILNVPGRGMPFNFGLWYDARALTVVLRSTPVNHQIWTMEVRPYIPSNVPPNGLWAAAQPGHTSTYYHKTQCYPDIYNQENGEIEGETNYIYHDASGGKHSFDAGWETGYCFYLGGSPWSFDSPGPDLTGDGDWAPNSVTIRLAEGTKLSGGGISPIGYGTFLDSNGNSKGEFAGGLDTLGRSLVTQQNVGSSIQYQVKDSGGTTRTYSVNYAPISISTAFNVSGSYGSITEYSGTRQKVTSIILPNGRQYTFQYDSYGSMTQMTLPTGGTITYSWTNYSNGSCTYRYVSNRTVTENGHVSTWTFVQTPIGTKTCDSLHQIGSPVSVTVTDPLGNQSVYEVSEGNITLAKIYQGAATGTPLRQYTITYTNFNSPNPWPHLWLPTTITTTLENGLVGKKEFSYDTFTYPFTYCPDPMACDSGGPSTVNHTTSRGNVTEIREYDWGQSTPTRRITKAYLHDANPAYLTPNIVSKVLTSTIYDAAGNQKAQTQYEYDNYVAGDNPLQVTSGVPQHDYTNFSSSFILRGNVTRVKRWRNTDGALLTTTYSYDDLGNIKAIKGPLSHTTSYSYNDSFANTFCAPPANSQAWVSQVTNPANQRIQVVRYPCTGLVQAHKNENDILAGRSGTTFTYDLLGRVTQKNFADGGQVATSYNDVPPVSSTSTTKITPTLNLVNTTIQDGLGRASQSKLTSDPEGTVFVDTTYDLLGRKRTVSNPYRPTGDPTYGITTTNYDALDRVTSVVEADNSTVTTSYAGNCTTMTDEANNARKSCSDALGRLTQVFEDPSVLNYETDYQYDALDNLTRVDQKGSSPGNSANWRSRVFTYNSLSQLLTASNPESGAITYTYNNDGNVLTKVAPKPNQKGSLTVTTTYSYDSLHRMTQTSYNDGTTPTAKYGYDGVAISGCTTTPPSLSDQNPKGARTAMCDGSGATSWNHDPMGRVLTEKRTVVGSSPWTKTAAYTYNKDGSIASISNPGIGRLISYTTSGAGRQTGVINSGGGLNFVKWATYAPFGGLTGSTNGYGTASPITVENTYSKRLQPLLIRASLASGPVLSLCYDFHLVSGVSTAECSFPSASPGDNGNVYQIVNNRVPSRTQNFVYDSLSRIKQAYTDGSNWGEDFTIDAWGNLTNRNSIAGKNNPEPLNAAPATTKNQLNGYCHDSAGNLALNAPCPQGTLYPEYMYDAENRLTGAGGFTYVYDGDGHRVKKTNGSSGTLYWLDLSGNTLTEANLGATNLHEYIYFGGKRVARIDVPAPLSVKYYFSDHLGSANVIVDDTGAVVKEADYYPYGGERWVSGADSNRYKFTGKERDAESGLDNFGARYMSSTMGRFMSADPSRLSVFFNNPQTWNRYSYVYNNPLRLTDDNGKWPTDIHNQIIDNSFPNLTAAQRQILKNVSAQQDSILGGGQANSASFEHAMRGPNQTVEQAQGQFNDFVSGTETSAQTAEWTFWLNDPDNAGSMSDEALARFGEALHAILDSTSPAHAGFQKWDWRNPALVIAHHNAEKTINPQQMQNAITAARNAFNSTFGMFGFNIAPPPKEQVTHKICYTDDKGKKVCQ